MAGKSGDYDLDDSDDDAFESLPIETLRELEEEAVKATQAPSTARPETRPKQNAPPQPKFPERSRPVLTSIRNDTNQTFRQSGSGAQEELVNLDDYSQGVTSYVPRPAAQAPPAAVGQFRYGLPKPMPYRRPNQMGPQQPLIPQVSQAPRGPDIGSLKATIQRLEKEKAALKQAAQDAETKAQSKSGEVAILRETITRSRSEYEERIEFLRKAQSEAAEKTQAEIQALQREKIKVETDRQFLQHDLAVETSKSKQTSKKGPNPPARTRSILDKIAPAKKSSFLNVGDGFDEQEMSRSSPRKNRSFDNGVGSPHRKDSARNTTPSHRMEKRRKRDVSPTEQPELSFHGPVDSPDFAPFTPDATFDSEMPLFGLEFQQSEKLEFIERIMKYRLSGSNRSLLEEMTKYSLPLDPTRTISRLVLEYMNKNDQDGESNVAMRFCNAVCEAWSQCLTERYHEPLDLLVEALNLVTRTQKFTFIRKLIDRVVFLASQTVELEAQALLDKTVSPQDAKDVPNLDYESCMRLLITIATACAGSLEHSMRFWKALGFKFIFLLLTVQQRLEIVELVCDLLTFSCTDDTFGPVYTHSDVQEVSNQEDVEYWIADRLTALLTEVPVHPEALPDSPFPLFVVLPFRLRVLDALSAMCSPPRGGVALAKHTSAIARLFEFLYERVETIYSYEPRVVSSPHLTGLTVACINKVMFVIYQVLKYTPLPASSQPDDSVIEEVDGVNVREKLKAVSGGEYMHTIALARLAFGEQPDLAFQELDPAELEIWGNVTDAAHRLLDEFLSPDEGEMLLTMYPSGDGVGTALGTGNEREKQQDVDMQDEDAELENDDERMNFDS